MKRIGDSSGPIAYETIAFFSAYVCLFFIRFSLTPGVRKGKTMESCLSAKFVSLCVGGGGQRGFAMVPAGRHTTSWDVVRRRNVACCSVCLQGNYMRTMDLLLAIAAAKKSRV